MQVRILQIWGQNLQFQSVHEPVRGVEHRGPVNLWEEGNGLPAPLVPLQHRCDEHPPRPQRLLKLPHLPLCWQLIQRPGIASNTTIQDFCTDNHHCFAVQKDFRFLKQREHRGLLPCFHSWQKPLHQVPHFTVNSPQSASSSHSSSTPQSPSQSTSTSWIMAKFQWRWNSWFLAL